MVWFYRLNSFYFNGIDEEVGNLINDWVSGSLIFFGDRRKIGLMRNVGDTAQRFYKGLNLCSGISWRGKGYLQRSRSCGSLKSIDTKRSSEIRFSFSDDLFSVSWGYFGSCGT